ncbi:MAG: alpha/beta hydrolase fold protein [Thermomicrobiales bacterium]|nr:alpha/beta hydrolase fold protein [Thermomicrobiales bacterium]
MLAEVIRVQVNGIDFRILRQGSGEPLVLLHGFTGGTDSWLPIAGELARDYRVHAIDLIGHGGSAVPEDGTRYAYKQAVDDLPAVLTALGIDRAAWLGYSLGGRLALGVALAYPERVSALILESATAGIRDEDERASRRISDEALANRIEQHGIEAFVAQWEALPMWVSQQSLAPAVLATQRAQRLANHPVGLANSLRGMGQGAQPSLWDRLGEMRAPTLLIAGALDAKFAGIAAEMSQAIPNAALALIPGAGHAVHLESPARFCEIVRAFLARRHAADTARQEVVC